MLKDRLEKKRKFRKQNRACTDTRQHPTMIALLTLVAATSIAAEGPCDILNAAGNPYGRLLWLCSSFCFYQPRPPSSVFKCAVSSVWQVFVFAYPRRPVLVRAWLHAVVINPSDRCVAAHSTVRALYGGYSGALYNVTRSRWVRAGAARLSHYCAHQGA